MLPHRMVQVTAKWRRRKYSHAKYVWSRLTFVEPAGVWAEIDGCVSIFQSGEGNMTGQVGYQSSRQRVLAVKASPRNTWAWSARLCSLHPGNASHLSKTMQIILLVEEFWPRVSNHDLNRVPFPRPLELLPSSQSSLKYLSLTPSRVSQPTPVSLSPILPIESSPAKSGRSFVDEWQPDAESGMNAQRAEFIHGQGAYAYQHLSSSR